MSVVCVSVCVSVCVLSRDSNCLSVHLSFLCPLTHTYTNTHTPFFLHYSVTTISPVIILIQIILLHVLNVGY